MQIYVRYKRFHPHYLKIGGFPAWLFVNYYEKVFGFEATQDKEVIPVMPYYDMGCVPMYYML